MRFRTIQWVGYVALILSILLIFLGLYRYFQIRARSGRYYQRNYEEPQYKAEKNPEKEAAGSGNEPG